MKHLLTILILCLSCLACTPTSDTQQTDLADTDESSADSQAREEEPKERSFPLSIENGKIFEQDGKKFLFGGEEAHMHFDITDCSLKDEQFHFGIGRERFPALLEPQFISVQEADTAWEAEDRFLLLHIGQTTKAYSVKDLTRHEVVNDVVEGRPIMAVYCILADLGAIYDRTIGDHTFTFALSGYTYFDETVWNGLDGFVMWDRETESLWWPLIGKAVSGPLKETNMKVLDEQNWSQTTWGDIKEHHPTAQVLQSGQDFERPANWPQLKDAHPIAEQGASIAPKWGENLGEEK
ncbi:MAG: DUF3179 domain-containing (seleno)protein [Bacteroidota bacterium]